MATWTDGYWWSHDGLKLHHRDYAVQAIDRLLARVLSK
jgi:hypothetical protein